MNLSRKTTEKSRQEGSSSHSGLWNLLTVLLILGTLFQTTYFIWLYLYPYTPYNLFPPPAAPTAQPVAEMLPSPTITETRFPNTPTPDNTREPVVTATLTSTLALTPTLPDPSETPVLNPSKTHTPNATIIEITPIPDDGDPSSIFFTPTATLRITYLYRFVLQSEPYAIAASSNDPNKDCNWMGVGGQVFDILGRPATGMNVQFGGVLDKQKLPPLITLTGTAMQYGSAGYEFKIADEAIDTYLSFWVQLVDQSGNPLSAKTNFSTFSDCEKNLIIINFKQVR